MAGYSGTPLARKLGIKEGHLVVLVDAPDGFEEVVAPVPARVEITRIVGRDSDVIVFFTKAADELVARFGPLRETLVSNGGLWIAWPKKASRVPTDLSGKVVRKIGLETGLVDNKVCAIDDTWSGLRFVIRVADR